MRQRQREIEMAKELGIVLDTDPSQVSDQGNIQSTSENNQTNNQENETQVSELD